jgi:hypothetical protein
MDETDQNTPIKRKRGRPAKPKISSANAENAPAKMHPNSLANLQPGSRPRKHIRKDVRKHLDELGFDPLTRMVDLFLEPSTPAKVRFDISKELLSYCSVKPKHQLQNDNVNALTELFALVATDGRPLPSTAVTWDAEAMLVDGNEDGDEEPEDADE